MPKQTRWRVRAVVVSLLVILSLVFSLPLNANSGRVRRVCERGCPYSSISAALNDSAPGDIVQIEPGIYLDTITMRPGVTIRGGGSHVSIITGGQTGTVVRAYGSAIDRTAVLEGVTIIAGQSPSGGGIEIRGGASPTIRNNLITGNIAGPSQASYGGGMFISGGAPLVTGNVFTRNYASSGGGAIAIWDDSQAVIELNRIEDNDAFQYGGGIDVTRSSPLITGNTIISNTATYGGGVDMSADSSPEFTNNILRRNQASANGGAVYLRSGSAPSIFANTFSDNLAFYYGGALYMDRSTAQVTGNLFEANAADSGGAIYIERSSAYVARNNILFNTTSFHGGGIHIHNSSPTVDSNNINYNTSNIGGGAVSIDGYSWPLVTNNVMADNAVGIHGGAVYIEGASPKLINNLIARNASSDVGGGIFLQNAAPLIQNNTICGNDLTGAGEGIYLAAQAFPTITNNIIIDNGYGIVATRAYTNPAEAPVILRNNVWNNHYGNFVGLGPANNISADPLFVRGRDGAFYLSQMASGQTRNSPSLNAGTAPARDLGLADRTTAVRDLPDEGIVDMGYHYRALFHKSYIPLILGSH